MPDFTYPCLPRRADGLPAPDDAVWDGLPEMELVRTETGEAPALRTHVRAFYDPRAAALCLRFLCEDDAVCSDYTQRDDPIYNQDVLEVFLCDAGDLHRYKEFEVSPRNVQFDADIRYRGPHDTTIGLGWDLAGWQTHTRFEPDARRLCSVWRMPLSGMDHTPQPGERWRMNVYRIDHSARGMELSAWSPTGEPNFHVPERFGWVVFR